jgi:hypothetical protein
MLQNTKQPGDKFKRIDQMLEDFAGDEVEDFEDSYSSFSHHKHYSADEDAVLDIDELY